MAGYRGVVFDIDGVLVRERVAIPSAAETLAALRARGVGIAFATNNASRAPAEVAAWLRDTGLHVAAQEVVTSVDAAARRLAGSGATSFTVGTAALRDGLARHGLALTDDWRAAEVVVVGFDPELRYPRLRDAALAIEHGARFLATNLDPTLPAVDGHWPGNGAVCALLTHATGVPPESAGKPAPDLIHAAIARLPHPGRVLVVGDRSDTDVAAGQAAGCDTALVLTGITRASDPPPVPAPTYVIDDVAALLRPGA